MIQCRIPLRASCCLRVTPFLWAVCMRLAATRPPDPTHSLTHCRKPSKSPSRRGEQWTVTTDDSCKLLRLPLLFQATETTTRKSRRSSGILPNFLPWTFVQNVHSGKIWLLFIYIHTYINCMLCVSHGPPTFSWQRATPVTVGRFAGSNW